MLSIAFYEFLTKFTHACHIYITGRVLFVCIGANKGLHDFFYEERGYLNFPPVGTLQFIDHRDYSLCMLWVTKNKVHGAFVFVLVAHSRVLH